MNSAQKVAIVTGASQGIGAGLVKAFRERDYRVVATSRSIKQSGDKDIVAVRGDVGDPADCRAVVREAMSRFGRIDTLVNNAGIFIAKPFTEYTADDFNAKICDQPRRLLPPHAARRGRDAQAGLRPHRQHHDEPR